MSERVTERGRKSGRERERETEREREREVRGKLMKIHLKKRKKRYDMIDTVDKERNGEGEGGMVRGRGEW